MRTSRFLVPGLIAAAAVACGGENKQVSRPEPAVFTARPLIRKVEIDLPFVGTAESARLVELRALVEGRVVAVRVADGARVRAGEVVFELGGARVAARRHALAVELEAAGRSVEAAAKRLEQARRRGASHLAAPGESTAAALDLSSAQTRRAVAESAQQRFLDSLSLTAPTAGRFARRRVSPGQELRPGDLLGEIRESGSLRIDAQVFPRPGLDPQPGQAAVIEGAGGTRLAATVTAIQPTAADAGTVQVWLSGDALRALAPGTVVRGYLVVALHEEAVTVPAEALVRDSDDGPWVFTASGTSYEKRRVTTGEEGPGWVEITSGVEPGEELVTRGAYELYWEQFGQQFKVED